MTPHGIKALILGEIKEQGLSLRWLAQASGNSHEAIRQWLTSDKMPRGGMAELRRLLAVVSQPEPGAKPQSDLHPYLAPRSPLGETSPVPGAGRRLYPQIGVTGAAAFPAESGELDPDAWLEAADEWHRPGRSQSFRRVVGDSQHPYIWGRSAGADPWVLVTEWQPTDSLYFGRFYCFQPKDPSLSHEALIKIPKRTASGHIALCSCNPDYLPELLSDSWSPSGIVQCLRDPVLKFELGDPVGLSPSTYVQLPFWNHPIPDWQSALERL